MTFSNKCKSLRMKNRKWKRKGSKNLNRKNKIGLKGLNGKTILRWCNNWWRRRQKRCRKRPIKWNRRGIEWNNLWLRERHQIWYITKQSYNRLRLVSSKLLMASNSLLLRFQLISITLNRCQCSSFMSIRFTSNKSEHHNTFTRLHRQTTLSNKQLTKSQKWISQSSKLNQMKR